jgi:SNF2 family DNA or RNA helicase
MVKNNPEQKIVVFSQYLRYLDIVYHAIKKRYGIECLRFDGQVPQKRRPEIQRQFKEAKTSRSLLMTAGTVSLGLDLTPANTVIQCEEWWSISAEVHTICRVWCQGQEDDVHWVKFFNKTSAIEQEIAQTRHRKVVINSELMKP